MGADGKAQTHAGTVGANGACTAGGARRHLHAAGTAPTLELACSSPQADPCLWQHPGGDVVGGKARVPHIHSLRRGREGQALAVTRWRSGQAGRREGEAPMPRPVGPPAGQPFPSPGTPPSARRNLTVRRAPVSARYRPSPPRRRGRK